MNRFAVYIKKAWVALLLPFCCISCMSHHDTAVANVDPLGWTDPAILRYVNSDTISVREAALVLRHGNEVFPPNGTYVVEVCSPSGICARDTLQAGLAPDLSENIIRESRMAYRRNVTLAEAGEYTFTIFPPQGARDIWSAAIDFSRNVDGEAQ